MPTVHSLAIHHRLINSFNLIFVQLETTKLTLEQTWSPHLTVDQAVNCTTHKLSERLRLHRTGRKIKILMNYFIGIYYRRDFYPGNTQSLTCGSYPPNPYQNNSVSSADSRKPYKSNYGRPQHEKTNWFRRPDEHTGISINSTSYMLYNYVDYVSTSNTSRRRRSTQTLRFSLK